MVITMRAVRLFAPGDVRCVEVERSQLEKDNDVIIKVKTCGVCGSDIMRVMEKGTYRYPTTIGHEFAGDIVSLGNGVQNLNLGDRVTVMPLIHCGYCNYCRMGEYVLCDNYNYYGSRIDGAMAEYIRVNADNVLKLPDNVDYEAGAMTDPVAVALHAVRKIKLEPGQQVVLLGMGPIGFLALQWLKIIGAGKVYVVDIFDEKLKQAESFGADYVINGKKQNVANLIKEQTNGEGVDAAIELAGNKVTQVQAIQVVRKMGTVVYCGISYDDLIIPNSELSKILRGELTLHGAWNSSISPFPINEWKNSLSLMDSGKIKTASLISHRFKLEECKHCFDMMYHKKELFNKVMFKLED